MPLPEQLHLHGHSLPFPSLPAAMVGPLLSVTLYATTLGLVHYDAAFDERWLAFALWMLSIAALPGATLWQCRAAVRCRAGPWLRRPRIGMPFLLLLLLALAFSFVLLVQYPYIAIYDQIRDGGLNAREVATGEIKNLFGFGRYNSHGIIIPTVAALFWRIFGSSTLTYRVPTALLAVADVGLLYLVMRRAAGRTAAWFAALTLLTLPLHLFYARTELVVMFSSLFMTVILLLMQRFLRDQSTENYLLLGVTLGFVSTFHGSILTVALVTLALVVVITAYKCWQIRPRAPLLTGVALMLLFYLVGFGPRLLFVSPSTYLHTNESFYDGAAGSPSSGAGFVAGQTLKKIVSRPGTLARNYLQSILVYGHEPTYTIHYPDWKPLLDPFVTALFLTGLVAAVFWSRNGMLRLIAVYAAAIPFTNSAITNSINGDNRLLPALPVAAALAGYGAAVLIGTLRRSVVVVDAPSSNTPSPAGAEQRVIPSRRAAAVLAGVTVAYLIVRGVLFFANRPAAIGYTADDYLSMHTIYFIRSHAEYRHTPQLCMAVTPQRFTYFQDPDNLLLVSEQYQYFLAGQTIRIYGSPDVAAGELYLSTQCSAERGHHFAEQIYCKHRDRFTCPDKGELKVYAEQAGVPARPAEGIPFLGIAWVIGPKPAYIP